MDIRPIVSVDHARALRKLFYEVERHPVLKTLDFDIYRGASGIAAFHEGLPVSVHVSKIGKRHKNIWEPYLNWYIAYTTPHMRRKGYAKSLYELMEAMAENEGCRRVKSLAGSEGGAMLHHSLGHQMWGVTAKYEIIVDSPLPGHAHLYTDKTPPTAQTAAPLTPAQLQYHINLGLLYDKPDIG